MSLLKFCATSRVEVEGNTEGSMTRFSETEASLSGGCYVLAKKWKLIFPGEAGLKFNTNLYKKKRENL